MASGQARFVEPPKQPLLVYFFGAYEKVGVLHPEAKSHIISGHFLFNEDNGNIFRNEGGFYHPEQQTKGGVIIQAGFFSPQIWSMQGIFQGIPDEKNIYHHKKNSNMKIWSPEDLEPALNQKEFTLDWYVEKSEGDKWRGLYKIIDSNHENSYPLTVAVKGIVDPGDSFVVTDRYADHTT
ncbi:hypothetical protein CL622_03790 [archaeon]|nr:hypothetical protein [archaeon]|tara:strand:+ start:110 stop:649 length:540 start_codon:yes stop_codon:yes gene_type:complete